jgi:hypothetical protein
MTFSKEADLPAATPPPVVSLESKPEPAKGGSVLTFIKDASPPPAPPPSGQP